jgi:tetracycline repressor-like protein
VASRGFRGCPFVNAVAELGDATHAARSVAIAFKEHWRVWFRDLVTRLGAEDPESLATQLSLLVDGAIAAALVRGDPTMVRAAREAARTLLVAAGLRVPAPEGTPAVRKPRRASPGAAR